MEEEQKIKREKELKLRGGFMRESNIGCRVPPSPKLKEKIKRSYQLLKAGKEKDLPKTTTVDFLDLASLTLIRSRPARTRAHTLVKSPRAPAPIVGERRALVLLVDFSDKEATESKHHYEEMLFSSGTYPNGSLRDFYREASYNKLTVTGDVSGEGGVTTGWYRAPKPYKYYANYQYGFGDYPKNVQKLVEDVVDLAAPYVNFAEYDNDGDGEVDALFIVHAGPGAEATGNRSDIWSHMWEIKPRTVDEVKVRTYSMEPEDGHIGVFCHELGHVFGLPDLYDYDYDSEGTGDWDLMAGGSWNGGGQSPAHPIGWCKVKLGWIDPEIIFKAQKDVTIKPYATNGQMYKLPINDVNNKEYFLLENRQKTGFDSYLPGEGLIITHIDENQTNNDDQDHYLVDIEQCDGKFDLNKGANRGDENDPYQCKANNEFTVSTTPNSKAYNGSDSKVAVTNIQRSGDDSTATVIVGVVTPKGAIIGKVVDKSSKKPIKGVNVSTDTGENAITKPDGAYKLDEVIVGDRTVTAKKDGYEDAPKTVTVREDEEVTVNFELVSEKANIKGIVINKPDGKPVDNATVLADTGQSTMTDAKGTYNFSEVTIGEHSITAFKAGCGCACATVAVKEGEVATADFELNCTIVGPCVIADCAVGLGKFDQECGGYPKIDEQELYNGEPTCKALDVCGIQAHAGYYLIGSGGKEFECDIDEYPILYLTMKAEKDTDTCLLLMVHDKIPEDYMYRFITIGKAPSANYGCHPVGKDYFTIKDDNKWHDYTYDLHKLREDYPDAKTVRIVQFYSGKLCNGIQHAFHFSSLVFKK